MKKKIKMRHYPKEESIKNLLLYPHQKNQKSLVKNVFALNEKKSLAHSREVFSSLFR